MKGLVTLLCALCALCGSPAHAAAKPNLVYIQSDDIGWGDISQN